MLNKINKQILPMLETLGDALGQYLELPSEKLLGEIAVFIDAIIAPLAGEGEDAVALSEKLKVALLSPVHDTVELAYIEFCETVAALPVQYKAVFLPYYDNTWDSLQSIYESFAADPMFVTEIIIIPIKRNTPSGDKHVYEDYLTPQGIPNTHYDQYDFETDMPDIVFYNQPYDGVNYPKFQSQNIRPHAGLMVYVPYYLYRHRPWGAIEQQRLTSTTQLPGHDNADVFVVQGESFLKNYAKRSRNGSKFVALGNPKCDNIYEHMQDYPRYPEWDDKTAGKTVFLLNTHYTSVVNGTYKRFLPFLLEKIEQNEEMALIWRPHPQSFLMFDENNQTQESEELNSFLDRVRSHPRMVLDRTINSASAIMYSAAVLSQDSSIVSESMYADKPVFLFDKNPNEALPDGLTYDEITKRLARIRRTDAEKLLLFSAVCYYGFESDMPEEAYHDEFFNQLPLTRFMDEIGSGIDSKKQPRSLYREQTFANLEGSCGRAIYNYIVSLLQTDD